MKEFSYMENKKCLLSLLILLENDNEYHLYHIMDGSRHGPGGSNEPLRWAQKKFIYNFFYLIFLT